MTRMIRVRPLEEANRAVVEALLIQAGSDPALLGEYCQHSRTQPGYVQIAFAGPQVVGCLLARHMRLRLGKAVLECAELWIVPADLPPEVELPLIEACLTPLSVAEISLIRLRGMPSKYASLGFAVCELQPMLALDGLPNLAGRWRAVSAADLPDLMALYDATYRHLALSEIRTAADWSERLLADCWLLEDNSGRSIGYVRLEDRDVTEAAVASAATRRLLGALGELPEPPSRLRLSALHGVMQAGLQLGGTLTIQALAIDRVGALIGVLGAAALLAQLLPELELRLSTTRYAGWSGCLWVELAAQPLGLRIVGETITVISAPSLDAVRLQRVTLGGLVQLALGYRSAADLLATSELSCDDAALGLVDALFGPAHL